MHSTPCQSHQSVSGSSQAPLAIHCSPPRVLYRSTRKSLAPALASEEQSRARMKTDAVVSLRCLQAAVFMVICYRWTRRVSKPDNSTLFFAGHGQRGPLKAFFGGVSGRTGIMQCFLPLRLI